MVQERVASSAAKSADKAVAGNMNPGIPRTMFYENRYKNDHTNPLFYQGIEAKVKYES